MADIDTVLVDMIVDTLDLIAPNWLDGQAFDVALLISETAGLHSTDDIQPEDRECIEGMLPTVGNVYGMTYRHNGDYAWFDVKTDENDIPTNEKSE